VKVHVLLLPQASVAVLVTVVTPTGKLVPLAGLLATVTPRQLSVALTLNVTLLLQAPSAAFTVRFVGQLSTGAVVSRTVTLALLVAALPHRSVPVQRRVTVALQAGPLVTVSSTATVTTPPQLSLNVGAVKLTALRHCTGPLPLPLLATAGAVVSTRIML
jgi:hypothetical protein